MQALKFETDVCSDTIKIPNKFRKNVMNHHIEVIMMYRQNKKIEESHKKNMINVFSDKFQVDKINKFSKEELHER
ncbi:MAG: hypothetical protein U9O87_07560 [Verrucomicrobiota bacterium]|nr:hypothetical protein [Verrucomicrobiota bacterium]